MSDPELDVDAVARGLAELEQRAQRAGELEEALRDLVQEFEAYAGPDAERSGYYRQAKAVLNG